MSLNFFKFPATPHLVVLQGVLVRGDKVMAPGERSAFLSHEILVEEKIDGANLGVSFDKEGQIQVQNRGGYLQPPVGGQWKKLEGWLQPRLDIFFEQLTDRYILFGEWCYARHSIYYSRLPDWFLGFDVYDKTEGRFLPAQNRDRLLEALSVFPVPQLARGVFALDQLRDLLGCSQFGNEPAEGLYMRHEERNSVKRAKLVRCSFIQAQEEHWSRLDLMPNRLNLTVEELAEPVGDAACPGDNALNA